MSLHFPGKADLQSHHWKTLSPVRELWEVARRAKNLVMTVSFHDDLPTVKLGSLQEDMC
jgi:hypothetical protein